MKKFITKFLVFAFIATITVVISFGGMYYIQSQASFKLPPNKNILIVGDSHNEDAINDDIFSRAVNVAQGGTAYLYSYCKIRKFLNENKHIDTILLSFHSVSLIGDGGIFREENMADRIPCYLTLFDKDDISVFLHKKRTLISAVFNLPYKLAFKFIIRKGSISYKDLGIGEYYKLDRYKLQEDIARNKNKPTTQETDIVSYQKEYLLKTVDLCKSKNVELILINPPTYKPKIYGKIDKVNDYYTTYFSGIKYLDYSAFPLADSCYADIGHLNYKGAEIFSKYLQENFNRDINAK
jgi:hypothetical protein